MAARTDTLMGESRSVPGRFLYLNAECGRSDQERK